MTDEPGNDLATTGHDHDATGYVADPNYFRLEYQLAALQLNEAIAENAQADFVASERSAERAVADAHAMLADYEHRTRARRRLFPLHWPPWRPISGTLPAADEHLRSFVATSVLPSAELVLAGALRAQGKEQRADAIVEDVIRGKTLDSRVYYNLACYMAGTNPDAPGALSRMEQAFGFLDEALKLTRADRRLQLIATAEHDPSLDPLSKSETLGPRFAQLLSQYRALTP